LDRPVFPLTELIGEIKIIKPINIVNIREEPKMSQGHHCPFAVQPIVTDWLLRPRRLLLASLGLLALGLPACSKEEARKPTFPVTGKVQLGNKPLAHASVVFHPVGESGPDVVKPRGKTDADGSFTLTTYDGNDGAPAGDYRVTVELWLSSGKGDEGPTSRLPEKYARPEKSGLSARVDAGPTELKPFDLKR
jgi:hypothetical protein